VEAITKVWRELNGSEPPSHVIMPSAAEPCRPPASYGYQQTVIAMNIICMVIVLMIIVVNIISTTTTTTTTDIQTANSPDFHLLPPNMEEDIPLNLPSTTNTPPLPTFPPIPLHHHHHRTLHHRRHLTHYRLHRLPMLRAVSRPPTTRTRTCQCCPSRPAFL
jgi:hypothetical protein